MANAIQLEELTFHVSDLPDERLPQFRAFSFLKTLRVDPAKKSFTPESQAQLKALLPKVAVTFGN